MDPENQKVSYLYLCRKFKEDPFYKDVNGTRQLDSYGEHYEYLFKRYKENR